MTEARKAAAAKPRKASPAAAARQAEAEDGYLVLEQCGVSLKIPLAGKVPIAARDAFLAGDEYGGIKAMLGPEQWKSLTDVGATIDDLAELNQKFEAAAGN